MRSKNCGSFFIKKCGFTNSKNQRFSCKDCSKKFTLKKKNKSQELYNSYIKKKKILSTLTKDNKTSISTIQRALKSIDIAKPVKLENIIQRLVQIKLTKKPPNGLRSKKSTVGVELLEFSKRLTMLSKESFIKELNLWQEKHREFLNEKSIDDGGRLRYTMPRSTHYTLKKNLAYIFTYESVEYLPKTNNGLEAEFAHLKTKLRVHSGLKLENKMSLFLRF